MSALFSLAYGSIFITIGVAAVIGHVVLIDLLMRPAAVKVAQAPTEVSRLTR